MAKKKRASKTSKGERRSISRVTVGLVRRGKSEIDKGLDRLKAWQKGKNPVLSRENGEKIRMNSVYGDPRKRSGDNGSD